PRLLPHCAQRRRHALYAAHHDLGGGDLHTGGAGLPGVDVLGVPQAADRRPHPDAVRPFDPRLLRHARATIGYLAVLVAVGVAAAGLVLVQADLLATGIAAVDTGVLVPLAAVVAGRALLAWGTEVAAFRASAAVKSSLRRAVLGHALRLGPRWLAGQRTGELTTLITRGVDALDGY